MKRQLETMPKRVGDGVLRRRPEEIETQSSWQRITIETVQAGQPRAYADTVYEYLVTFEGGTPSTRPGWDLPFAIMPPFKDPEDRPGVTVVGGPSREERKQSWEHLIRDRMRAVAHGWAFKKDDPERPWHAPYLDLLEPEEVEPTHTTWRLRIVQPFTD
jgi:hypothetical protein